MSENKYSINALKLDIDNNSFYFLLPYGLGDSMFFCAYKDAIENKIDGQIHVLIKPSHEVIMKMYKITNYTIVDIANLNYQNHEGFCEKPQKGSVFIAHPDFHIEGHKLIEKFNKHEFSFSMLYKNFFEVSKDADFKKPLEYPSISETLLKKINKISSLDKVILIAPEANSMENLNKYFWMDKVAEFKKLGFSVICNVADPKNKISETLYFEMDTEDLIALAVNCKHVYTLRSGLCDLIVYNNNGLTVYYPNDYERNRYSLNSNFPDGQTEEIILNDADDDSVEKKEKKYLFGRIPFYSTKKWNRKTKYYLFGLLPILKITHVFDNSTFYLFSLFKILEIDRVKKFPSLDLKNIFSCKKRKFSKTDQPKVTIVTITYNLFNAKREKLFRQCVESVHNQTYENIEHIIIDGASTDGTLQLIKEYESKGFLKCYSEPDSGIYYAMNKGIEKANGKYIAFLNSDDFYHNKNGVMETVKALENNDVDYAFSKTKLLLHPSLKFFKPYLKSFYIGSPFAHSSLFCKKDVLVKENGFDTDFKISSDYDLFLRLILNKYKKVEAKTCLATFRCDGISHEKDLEELIRDEHIKAYYKNFKPIYVHLTWEDCKKINKKNFICNALRDRLEECSGIKLNNDFYIYLFGIFPICKIKYDYKLTK